MGGLLLPLLEHSSSSVTRIVGWSAPVAWLIYPNARERRKFTVPDRLQG
jgi:hypothetical protein